MELVERTESSVVATRGNLVVAIHDRQVPRIAMQRVGVLLDEAVDRNPEGICLLWISLTVRPHPDSSALRDRLELIQRPGEGLLGLAFVTERGGLGSVLKRGAAEEVRGELGAVADRMGIFESVAEAFAFLGPRIRPAVTLSELRPELEALWQATRRGGPKLPA
jgi:hypothetical protein